MFREESEVNGRGELNQKDRDKSRISYLQTKKTDIVEMYNFIKDNKEMDWEKFQKWLKDNGFNQTGYVYNLLEILWFRLSFLNIVYLYTILGFQKPRDARHLHH